MDDSQGIKIVDKRRFNEDGEASSSSIEKADATQPIENQTAGNQPGAGQVEQQPSQQEIDFASFLVGVYSQTLIYLGDIPNPETGLLAKNIDAARQNIDILSILQEKTKGNLSHDEDGLMNEILNNLRMIFIKKL